MSMIGTHPHARSLCADGGELCIVMVITILFASDTRVTALLTKMQSRVDAGTPLLATR
jgi:hypothetical protein